MLVNYFVFRSWLNSLRLRLLFFLFSWTALTRVSTTLFKPTLSCGTMAAATTFRRASSRALAKSISPGFPSTTNSVKWNSVAGLTTVSWSVSPPLHYWCLWFCAITFTFIVNDISSPFALFSFFCQTNKTSTIVGSGGEVNGWRWY